MNITQKLCNNCMLPNYYDLHYKLGTRIPTKDGFMNLKRYCTFCQKELPE